MYMIHACMYIIYTICLSHLPVFHCMLVQQELWWREPFLLLLVHLGKKPSFQCFSMRHFAASCGCRNRQLAEQRMQAVKTRFLLALQATHKLADGLLCFSCVWPCIKKFAIFWTGTAPILVFPCTGGLWDITAYCISVSAPKTWWNNWLYPVCVTTDNVCTKYIHCMYIVKPCIYINWQCIYHVYT